jgi:thiol:disulfide interchange protein DsbD
MTSPVMRLLAIVLLWFAACLAQAEEPLHPEQAFKLSARMLDAQTILVRYDIVRGYYMYRDKFAFEAPPALLGQPELPPGIPKDDPTFGRVDTFRDRVEIRVPVQPSGATPAVLRLKATSQGCADLGICYPPQEQFLELKLVAASETIGRGGQPDTGFVTAGQPQAGPGASEESSILALLSGGSFWLVVLSFFGFGIALAFTPCVLPMIPILSGIVVGGKETATRGRALRLSLIYVLGMALTYAAAGVAAGLSGSMLAAALQNPWVLGSFALLFVALACSMFGLYDLQLPSGVQSWLAERSNHFRGGQSLGVFFMGVLSALIVGPCIAPPLAGALLFIAERGDVVLGGSALFAMALGMGVPLIGVGISAGTLMPKAGPWMQSVKNFFGVVLLGVAIWVVSPVIPTVVHMLAWGALLLVSAVYLHAIDPLPAHASGYRKLWKGVGVIALLTGAALVLGALAGGRDILQPLSALRVGTASVGTTGAAPVPAVAFERVASTADLDARIAAAKGSPVMLDFYADWCVACKEMERFTFSDEGVKTRMNQFVLLKADVTANNADDKALLKRFSLFGPPGIIFFDREGREVKGLRVIGFTPAERFAPVLDQALR